MQHGVTYGFFGWVDPFMCERSKQIILGLLRRVNDLENEVGQKRKK